MPLTALIDDKEIYSFTFDDEEWELLRRKNQNKEIDLKLKCCGQNCFLRTSHLGTKHFYHKVHSNCHAEGESYEHLYLKKIIHDTCKEFGCDSLAIEKQSEEWISDIYCEIGMRKIVFEIQTSPQTVKTTIERTRKYQKEGIECYWIFKKYPKNLYELLSKIIKLFCINNVISFDISETKKIHILTYITLDPSIGLLFLPCKLHGQSPPYHICPFFNNKTIPIDKYVFEILTNSIENNISTYDYILFEKEPLISILRNLLISEEYRKKRFEENEELLRLQRKTDNEMQKFFEIIFVYEIIIKINNDIITKYFLKISLIRQNNIALFKIFDNSMNVLGENEYSVTDIIDKLLIQNRDINLNFIRKEFLKIISNVEITMCKQKMCVGKFMEDENMQTIKIEPDNIIDLLKYYKKHIYLI